MRSCAWWTHKRGATNSGQKGREKTAGAIGARIECGRQAMCWLEMRAARLYTSPLVVQDEGETNDAAVASVSRAVDEIFLFSGQQAGGRHEGPEAARSFCLA